VCSPSLEGTCRRRNKGCYSLDAFHVRMLVMEYLKRWGLAGQGAESGLVRLRMTAGVCRMDGDSRRRETMP